MRVPQVLAIRDKIDFSLRIRTEVDTDLFTKMSSGKAVDGWFDIFHNEAMDLKTGYFKDEKGQLKYSLITGQILDYFA
jgi:hypothetical protein